MNFPFSKTGRTAKMESHTDLILQDKGKTQKKSRNDLTLEDKVKALEALDKRIPQTEIAKNLGCSQSQISRIASRRKSILALWKLDPQNTGRKRMKKNLDIESRLRDWFCAVAKDDTAIPLTLITQQALAIAKEFHRPTFVPTEQWLRRWKNEFKVGSHFRTICEESFRAIKYSEAEMPSNMDIEMFECDSKVNIEISNVSLSQEELQKDDELTDNTDVDLSESDSKANVLIYAGLPQNVRSSQNELQNAETFPVAQLEDVEANSLYDVITVKEEPVDVEEPTLETGTFFKSIPLQSNDSNHFSENVFRLVRSDENNYRNPTSSNYSNPNQPEPESPESQVTDVLNKQYQDIPSDSQIYKCDATAAYRNILSVNNSEQCDHVCKETAKQKSLCPRITPSAGAALDAVTTIRKFLQCNGHEDFMCLDEVEEHIVDTIRILAAMQRDNK